MIHSVCKYLIFFKGNFQDLSCFLHITHDLMGKKREHSGEQTQEQRQATIIEEGMKLNSSNNTQSKYLIYIA